MKKTTIQLIFGAFLLALMGCGGSGDTGQDDAGTEDSGQNDGGLDAQTGCDDMDMDGICNVDDVCPGGDDLQDTDTDGVCDFLDACANNDDAEDIDSDGIPDACDTDSCGAESTEVGQFATWPGKVNVHRSPGEEWEVDSDCNSGAGLNTVTYCQSFWPASTDVFRISVDSELKPFHIGRGNCA